MASGELWRLKEEPMYLDASAGMTESLHLR